MPVIHVQQLLTFCQSCQQLPHPTQLTRFAEVVLK